MFRLVIKGDLGFEFWKDIPGYEGLYQVSTYGRVRSLDYVDSLGRLRKGQILAKTLSNNDYYVVTLKKRGKKQYLVHRLVAMTFLSNPENKPCVDHKDTDRANCRVENLHWVTFTENMMNPVTKKLMRDYYDTKQKQTYVYTEGGVLVGIFKSLTEAGKYTGVPKGTVTNFVDQNRVAKGFIFRYSPLS